ncbi:guanylate kinase [Porticoccaceae bacterium]|nr:guanylate kinase [Porticoccaceae bacterium]MDA8681580.1 guanylate kinase [Porticoccaceae bacterium]MDA8788525.1 guanylate kinase [Porticoccaceae bacterium]MDB2635103.1 guanylate kinase [Porticoccaceae bacterium]
MKIGTLFIISAPSGAGKTSLVAKILTLISNIQASISHTTRPCRPGEINGVNYHFVDVDTFRSMITEHLFLEHASVFDNYYGTSKQWVKDTLAAGTDVILEIDWQGAEQARKQFPESCSIFILPPSINALEQRLKTRGQDDNDVIATRTAAAQEEMRHCVDADYVVINDVFEKACDQLVNIIYAQRCRLSAIRDSDVLQNLLS